MAARTALTRSSGQQLGVSLPPLSSLPSFPLAIPSRPPPPAGLRHDEQASLSLDPRLVLRKSRRDDESINAFYSVLGGRDNDGKPFYGTFGNWTDAELVTSGYRVDEPVKRHDTVVAAQCYMFQKLFPDRVGSAFNEHIGGPAGEQPPNQRVRGTHHERTSGTMRRGPSPGRGTRHDSSSKSSRSPWRERDRHHHQGHHRKSNVFNSGRRTASSPGGEDRRNRDRTSSRGGDRSRSAGSSRPRDRSARRSAERSASSSRSPDSRGRSTRRGEDLHSEHADGDGRRPTPATSAKRSTAPGSTLNQQPHAGSCCCRRPILLRHSRKSWC